MITLSRAPQRRTSMDYAALIGAFSCAAQRYDQAEPARRPALAGEAALAARALHEYFAMLYADRSYQDAWAYIAECWEARHQTTRPVGVRRQGHTH